MGSSKSSRRTGALNDSLDIYGVASSDVESSEYDLGTTSVRLVRVGNIIQILFSNKMDAKIYFSETASRFKRAQAEFKGE